jgi:histidyl-tRNA synthetase
MAIQAPKGTKDTLPQYSYKWQHIEAKLKSIAALYGAREMRTPMFEYTELFTRGVGETTDVVQKEMYTFNDKGNRSITLKAEGTAPAVRAFVENGLFNEIQPTKLYYITPVFRYENVQKGRLREHHQFGIEVFGSTAASLDAEVIALAMQAYEEFGITGLELRINSIGCIHCRKNYNEALKLYLSRNYDELCHTCKTRFDKNPMRILDCKEMKCKEIVKKAPVILDFICPECSEHFSELKEALTIMNIAYTVDSQIVRGLDYYSKTVFEILLDGVTLCGGGRYDYLIEECGGPEMPAIGFGMGIERLLMVLEEKVIEIRKESVIELFVGSMGDLGKLEAIKLVNAMRRKGVKCDCDHMDKSVKAQMKYANKIEIATRTCNIKKMSDGETFSIDFDNLEEVLDIIKTNK